MQAARHAGLGRSTLYEWRDEDATFADDWDDAIAEYAERLEREADRRAVEGTVKPLTYKGRVFGTVQEFSDVLLMFRLKALKPEQYKDRSEQKHDITVTVQLEQRLQHSHQQLEALRNGHSDPITR